MKMYENYVVYTMKLSIFLRANIDIYTIECTVQPRQVETNRIQRYLDFTVKHQKEKRMH